MSNDELIVKKVDQKDLESFILEGTRYGSAMITKNKLISGFPKPKEILEIPNDPEKQCAIENIVPKKRYGDREGEGFEVRADIILADTIPSRDLQLYTSHTTLKQSAQISVLRPEQIMEEFKNNTNDNPITIGCLRLCISGQGIDVKYDFAIRINKELKFDWYPVISISERLYDTAVSNSFDPKDRMEFTKAINELIELRDKFTILWYGVQLALLNPVIKGRVHRTTIPAPEDLSKGPSKNKNKKTPKRYVKRITIGDISDIEIGETRKPHSISEPFWWVSGHMRNQKVKDGHKLIFVQGYWKGPLREQAEQIYSEPRQRELVQ